MKLMKKISAVLLSLCLLMPCFTMVADAADGRISFTDPSTAVGEYVEVKCVLRSTSGNMGSIEVGLTYDESYLRFDSGDGIETNGSGALTCKGSANSAEVTFVAKFQALQEGTTKVEISSATVSDANSASLTLDQGNSTITIAEGDASAIEENTSDSETPAASASDISIDVNGVSYTLTDEFADTDIPNGYSRTTVTLDGEERQMVTNESGNVSLGYLRDADNIGEFFLYHEETASFSPYAEITISDKASIIVLSDTAQVSLPSTYMEAKLELNGKEFPVWQDTVNEGMYIFYAMNNSGESGLYQYDSVEATYQRIKIEAEEDTTETESNSLLGKVAGLVDGHMTLVIPALLAAGVLGLLIIIVLAVKLHNRNAEIDELYDEYGIDLEEDEEEEEQEETVPVKKESKWKRHKKEALEEELEEEDFEEEEFEEADFEEAEFEEAEFEEADFEEVSFEETDFEDDFEEFRKVERTPSSYDLGVEEEFTGFTERMDFTIDDLDELLEEKSGKKMGHVEDDDTFKMDFIDLD